MQDASSPLQGFALAVTDSSHPLTREHELAWQGDKNRFEGPSNGIEEQEGYGAVIYPDRVEVPFEISGATVSNRQFESFLQTLPKSEISEATEPQDLVQQGDYKANDDIDIFVCVSSYLVVTCICADMLDRRTALEIADVAT